MPASCFPCDDCGHSPVVEIILPDDVWAAIADGAYCLCADCMDVRMIALGIKATGLAYYHGQNLKTQVTPEILQAAGKWRLPWMKR